MLKGEFQIEFLDDGTFRVNSQKATADGGSAEIQVALQALAIEAGGTWEEEKHVPGQKHHHYHHGHGHDHHRH